MESKTIEVNQRIFVINKLNARDSLKLVKLITSKVMPMFSDFITNDKVKQVKNLDEKQAFEAIQKCLTSLDDSDLDKIIDYTLMNCYEKLKAGSSRVLNTDGTYGVQDVENDLILTLRLVLEVLIFNFKNFFDVNRWNLMFKPIANTFQQSVKM